MPSSMKISVTAFAVASMFVGHIHAEGLTGQYLGTGNISTLGESLSSLNQKLGLNYAPAWTSGNFDYRYERYTEPSFHGAGNSQVNERKFESQLMYNHPINDHLTANVGYLYHANRTFRDNYHWAVAGLTLSGEIAPNVTASTTALIEKRNKGGRAFYDLSGNVEYKPAQLVGIFAAAHIYENLGESDINPTRKREFEVGLNYYISKRYYAGISHFKHYQIGDPTDRFALTKLKVGVNF